MKIDQERRNAESEFDRLARLGTKGKLDQERRNGKSEVDRLTRLETQRKIDQERQNDTESSADHLDNLKRLRMIMRRDDAVVQTSNYDFWYCSLHFVKFGIVAC